MIIDKLKTFKKNRITKVGFIVQEPSVWDKLKNIYNKCQNSNDIEAWLIIIPPFNWNSGTIHNSYINNYFINKYNNQNIIKLCKNNNELEDISKYKFDYIFYERPYNMYLPENIKTNSIVTGAKLCYVPYGYGGAPIFDEYINNNDFFDNIDYVFCESEYHRNNYINIFNKKNLNNIKVISTGYPCLEDYISLESKNKKDYTNSVLWTPRFSYDKKMGGSHFLEYESLIQKYSHKNNLKLIFRPHPQLFSYLIRENIVSKDWVDTYLKKLSNNNIIYDTKSTILHSASNSDFLITDFSSIIINYFITGKPIIYCPCNIKLNPIFSKIIDLSYVANNEAELKEHINNIKNGIDKKRNDRLKYVRELSMYNKNASNRIIKILN